MATVAELERLEALVQRLVPLSTTQRGELIQADHWNTVVGTLIELAQAVLAEEREGTVPLHEHPEQVSIGWLNTRMRSLVQKGPLADPAAVARVGAVERRQERFSDDLASATDSIRSVRAKVTDVASRDLVREAEVKAVRRAIEGLVDAREDVLDLRQTLRELQANVTRAVEISDSLTVDGEPVDVGQMEERLQMLEELRELLRWPSGDLLSASNLELRLTDLTNTMVTEDELDQFNSEFSELQEKLTDRVDSALQEIQANLNEIVAGIIDNILPPQLEPLQSGLGALQEETGALQNSVSALEEQVAALGVNLGDLAEQIAPLEDGLVGLQERMAQAENAIAELQAEIDPVSAGVANLQAQVTPLESGLTNLQEQVTPLESGLANLQEQVTPLESGLAELQAQVDEIASQLSGIGTVSDRVDALENNLNTVPDLVAEEVARVSDELAGGIGQEVEARVMEQTKAFTVDFLNEVLPGMVAEEVARILEGGGSSAADDFTVISGIGETRAKLLVEAGVTTYAVLADISTERASEIMRVSFDEALAMQDEARQLANL